MIMTVWGWTFQLIFYIGHTCKGHPGGHCSISLDWTLRKRKQYQQKFLLDTLENSVGLATLKERTQLTEF
jgi:hypothetical protein